MRDITAEGLKDLTDYLQSEIAKKIKASTLSGGHAWRGKDYQKTQLYGQGTSRS